MVSPLLLSRRLSMGLFRCIVFLTKKQRRKGSVMSRILDENELKLQKMAVAVCDKCGCGKHAGVLHAVLSLKSEAKGKPFPTTVDIKGWTLIETEDVNGEKTIKRVLTAGNPEEVVAGIQALCEAGVVTFVSRSELASNRVEHGGLNHFKLVQDRFDMLFKQAVRRPSGEYTAQAVMRRKHVTNVAAARLGQMSVVN